MTESAAPTLSIEPVISWPREAVPGKQYLLTVDLRTSPAGGDWPFPGEEVEFRCLLDAYPLFVSEPLDDPVLVVHRFGGTYRPVRYLLNAQSFPADEAPEAVYLSLTTRWGVPVRTVRLPVHLAAAPPPVIEALAVPLTSTAPDFPLQATTLPDISPPVDIPEPEPEPEPPASRERDRPGRTVRLAVVEFQSLTRWRLLLTDEIGAALADHEVRLDQASWQFEAFTDLARYLSWHAATDTAASDQARIIADLGAWIGAEVLGPIAGALADQSPVTVRVMLPAAARSLVSLPLELAHVGGEPLALRGITLVWDTNGDPHGGGASAAPVGERLRVLGLFSLPGGGQPLNLRRERYSLVRMIQAIAATGRAVDVRVLQYGVTRGRLRSMLEEAEGWDIVHISGHGMPGEILLETAAGEPDRVTADELIDLLDLHRGMIKLVTLSSCWSGTATADNQRRLAGLPVRSPVTETMLVPGGDDSGTSETMAATMAGRLGCAVLAMRYPVTDEFAITLTDRIYDLLISKGQPLPRTVALALRELLPATGRAQFPAMSAATPILVGASAVGLTLAAPRRTGPEDFSTAQLKLAGFPSQPERFVGRTQIMARASAALAPRGGFPGVLLYGMPGSGKTACALELAYTHEHDFDRLVWYKAPDEDQDISGALADFTLTLERDLPGLRLVHLIDDTSSLSAFLPQLTELVKQRRLLIVIDNAESLLSADGYWRDERWGLLIEALCAQNGFGRIVLTSRRLPAECARMGENAGLGAEAGIARLLALPVDALSLDEALLLARELPHLGRLVAGELPGMNRDLARQLAVDIMNAAQGHPRLLELADGQADDASRLTALVEAADRARPGTSLPDGFFADGNRGTRSPGAAEDYLNVLAFWTYAVADTLTAGERDLFMFLCCLEETDRIAAVLDGTWASIWGRLERGGQPPGLNQALAVLGARGLAVIRGEGGHYESCAVHPGVAAAGRAAAGEPFRYYVDSEVSAFWATVFGQASGEGTGSVNTGVLVRAGLAAVPYLVRRQQWDLAAPLLERAFLADPARGVAAAVLPAARLIADSQSRHALLLSTILRVIDLAPAYGEMRRYLDIVADAGDHRAAAAAAARLGELCLTDGRSSEAVTWMNDAAAYTRRAGLGPLTQLGAETRRLQVLAAKGEASPALDEVRRLLGNRLPPADAEQEAVAWWNVREALLGTGRDAAVLLEQWDEALTLGAQLFASMQDRSAPDIDLARGRFGDYFPLLRLGRTDDAFNLLLQCQQIFRADSDAQALGMVLSALADAEDARGHGDSAIALERDALRYKYLSGDVPGIAASYHNLGNYLAVHAPQPAPALACHLAAALIRALAETGGSGSVAAAAADRRELGASVTLPADPPDLSRLIGDIPGTDLAGLIARLSPDQAAAEYALDQLVQAMNTQASPSESAVSGLGSSVPGAARPGASTPGGTGFILVQPRSEWVQDPVSRPAPVNQFVTILPRADRRPADIVHMVTRQDSAPFDNLPEPPLR